MSETDLTPEQAQEEKILKSFFSSLDPMKLKSLPSKQQKLQAVVRQVAKAFEPGRTYSEQEVKEILAVIYADHATLRRSLIDLGYLKRTSDGRSYWREKSE